MSYCAIVEADDIQCSHARKELAVKFHVLRSLYCQRFFAAGSAAGQRWRILHPAAALFAALLNHPKFRNHHRMLVVVGLSGRLQVG